MTAYNRRELLAMLLASSLLAPAAGAKLGEERSGEDYAHMLIDLYQDWMENSRLAPVEFLSAHLGRVGDKPGVERAIRADFAAERVYLYQGWVLSQTEAALGACLGSLILRSADLKS